MTWEKFVELWFNFNMTNFLVLFASLYAAGLWTFVINPLWKWYRRHQEK